MGVVSTSSTVALQDTLVDRLLTTVSPVTGQRAADMLTGGFWWNEAPDDVQWPAFAVGRLMGLVVTDPLSGRMTGTLEVMTFARPRAQATLANAIADLFDGAMLSWRETSDGLIYVAGQQRDELPQFTTPADREVVQIRQRFMLLLYPTFLTRYIAS